MKRSCPSGDVNLPTTNHTSLIVDAKFRTTRGDVNYITVTSCGAAKMDGIAPHLVPNTKDWAVFLVSSIRDVQHAPVCRAL